MILVNSAAFMLLGMGLGASVPTLDTTGLLHFGKANVPGLRDYWIEPEACSEYRSINISVHPATNHLTHTSEPSRTILEEHV